MNRYQQKRAFLRVTCDFRGRLRRSGGFRSGSGGFSFWQVMAVVQNFTDYVQPPPVFGGGGPENVPPPSPYRRFFSARFAEVKVSLQVLSTVQSLDRKPHFPGFFALNGPIAGPEAALSRVFCSQRSNCWTGKSISSMASEGGGPKNCRPRSKTPCFWRWWSRKCTTAITLPAILLCTFR